MRPLILLACCAGGCVTYYPGDGQLVIVELDPAFSDHKVQDTDGTMLTEAQCLAQGIRWWDVFGARLRTRDQLTVDDRPGSAPVLQIFRNDAIIGGDAGDYEPAQGVINLYSISLATIAPVVRDMAAHETGHAIGLDHVSDRMAVMYYFVENLKGPSYADCQEFHKHWPNNFAECPTGLAP